MSARAAPRRTPSERARQWEAKKADHNEWRQSIGLKPHRYSDRKPRRLLPQRRSPHDRAVVRQRQQQQQQQQPLLDPVVAAQVPMQPPQRAAPHVVPLILLAAAAVPMMCTWSAWASNYGFIAILSAFLMSSTAVVALITTPIAQDVASADEAQLEETEAASVGGKASLAASEGGESSPLLLDEPTAGYFAGCFAGCVALVKAAVAWFIHVLMGISGVVQLLLLFVVPPETTVAIVVSVLCCAVQMADSFSRLTFGRSLASRIGATRHLDDCARILDAHWNEMARATQLTADAIATRTTLVLAERSLFSRVARLSLRLAYRSSRDVLHLIQHAEPPW